MGGLPHKNWLVLLTLHDSRKGKSAPLQANNIQLLEVLVSKISLPPSFTTEHSQRMS